MTIKDDLATCRVNEAEHCAAKCGLATTAFAHKAEGFTRINIEGHIINGLHPVFGATEEVGFHREIGLQIPDAENGLLGIQAVVIGLALSI